MLLGSQLQLFFITSTLSPIFENENFSVDKMNSKLKHLFKSHHKKIVRLRRQLVIRLLFVLYYF